MDKHTPASGENQPLDERPFRRAYAWPILWGPWVTSVIGLALLIFGMTANSPVPVQATALALGPITIVGGLLLPRVQGSLELSATGFKGQIDRVPAALVLAQRAAEIVIPEDEPNRDERASDAAWQALRGAIPRRVRRRHGPRAKDQRDLLKRRGQPGGPPAVSGTLLSQDDDLAHNRLDIIGPTDEPPPAKPS